MNKFNFENLNTYQEGITFVNYVYGVTKNWPDNENYSLTSQFRRAATSIVLNIAEGSSRTRKDFRHFLDLSRGSCYECVAIVSIAKKLNYITQKDFDECYENCNKIARMISALKKSIQ